MRNKSVIYVASLILIAGIASITYSCHMMNGIGEWIEETPSASPEEPLPEYISGEVSLTQIDNTFVADTSKVIYGADENPNNLIPSFSWYIDNQGDREWTAIPDVSTDTLTLKDAYLDCNIRVEVKESTGTLKGAVYAEKVYTKTPELYISGEVSLTQVDNTFVADTSKVIYGIERNPNNLIPGFSWYIDNKGDRDWTAIPDVSTDTLTLKDDYLDCNIRVEVTASPLKGAVYAQKVYPKTPELYISGEVSLTETGSTFVADTSKVIYGVEGNPDELSPSFTWYVDDKGDRKWTAIENVSTNTLTLKDEYLDCNIRVEVKESTGTLKGAVYAEKVYTKTPELYISGEVSLTQVDNTFVADATKVVYGEDGNPNNLIPSFSWYVDNKRARNWTAIENASTDTLTLKDDYLDCNIRVEVKESTGTLKGAVYAEKTPKLYISGEVSLTQETDTLTLTADTSGVISLGNTLNYKWYVEDDPWTVITGDTNTISLPYEYIGKLVRLEVTAPPLKGALYAYKLILTVPLAALAELKAPAILSEKIGGKEYFGTEPGGIADALAWIDGQTPGTGSIYADGLGLNGKNGGQGWKMDGTKPRAADYPLGGRVFRINLENDEDLGPQTLGDSSGTSNYPNIKAPNLTYPVSITIIGNPTANGGATSDWNNTVDLRLNAQGSLIKLADNSYISLSLEGALTLEGLTMTRNIDDDGGKYNKIIAAGLATDSMDNTASLVYVGKYNDLTMKGDTKVTGNACPTSYPGGIKVTRGTLTMKDNAKVIHNVSKRDSLMISNSTLDMYGNAEVSGNESLVDRCAGIYVFKSTVTMQDYAKVSDNTAKGVGGIQLTTSSTLTMSGNAKVSNNTAKTEYSGGILVEISSTLIMKDNAEVSGNTAGTYAGGIYVKTNSTLTMQDYAKVSNNTAKTEHSGGIYVYDSSTLDMSGHAEISNNTADTNSGGIRAYNSSITMSDYAKVSGNRAKSTKDPKGGGGITIFASNFEMSGSAEISGNVTDEWVGGGVLWEGTTTSTACTFKMRGGVIKNNRAGVNQNQMANVSGTNTLIWPEGTTGYVYATEGDTNPSEHVGPVNIPMPVTEYKVEAVPTAP
ncbi:MAG: right-handed parallel beta-helix repeat-containing protein [Spirochaetaceae bacterium]|nr:right-handed parallel beta-helix repeat-containing protein [Spirochaetaceae bacterium]